MATELGATRAPSQPDAAASMESGPIVDLVIVSPSVGVPQPLRFPGTPASTTIKQLKAKIRDALALRPTEENQRLIHRGRALVRDADTLLDILGADSIAADRQQTMHLVIRDIPPPAQPASQSNPAPATNIAAGESSPASVNGAQVHTQAQRPSPHEQYLNMMQRRFMQGNRDMMTQVLNQGQRGRAQMGMRGIGDTNPPHVGQTEGRDRRASPSPVLHTFPQENGPNVRTYRVETTVRMSSSGPNGLSAADLHNVFQSADANQATMTMTNAMNNAMNNTIQRSSSSASLHSRLLTQPGVTIPYASSHGSRAGSGRNTPFSGVPATPANGARPVQEVYILSSPEGPRALLVNNATSETYFTPRLSARPSLPRIHNPAFSHTFPNLQRAQSTGLQHPQPAQPHEPLHPYQTFFDGIAIRGNNAQQPQNQPLHPEAQQAQAQQPQQPQGQRQPALQVPLGHGLGHRQMHPPVAAIPPLLRMLWPHLWLIFRLALFVWIFTSNGASWSRWMTIIGLAVFIFVLSTGALNGLGEHIMRPVGRHLDNLLPALDGRNGRGANVPRPAAGGQGPAAGMGGELQPEQLAERLLNERRGPEGWFTGQFRRVERASLLFLASIAPGVAERHIAHLEAEAARQRREAEEAAARAREAADREAADREAAEAESQPTEVASEGTEMTQAGSETRTRTDAPIAQGA